MPRNIHSNLLFCLMAFSTDDVAFGDDFPRSMLIAQSPPESDRVFNSTYAENDSTIEVVSLSDLPTSTVGGNENRDQVSKYETENGWLQSLSFFVGIDGSKQPQDFGVNANLGLQGNVNSSFAVNDDAGLGLQLGAGIVGTQNAVRVYELLGQATDRVQGYGTVGLFQRTDSGFIWAVAHDFMVEESYDQFVLSQWRGRVGFDMNDVNQVGINAQIRGMQDSGSFAGGPVSLRTINQGSMYWRHVWASQTQTTFWLGLADGHGENNAVTGPSPAKATVPLFGADFLAPLNDHFALYGETNLIMPADTGTVDAFLGIQWYPGGGAKKARRGRLDPVFSVAAPTSFAVDLR